MACFKFVPIVLLAVTSFSMVGARAAEPDAAEKPADERVLQALPKVPTLATIVGDGSTKAQVGAWIQELMKKKETKARVEIVILKQKLIAEQQTQDADEKERIRRKNQYDKAHGTLYDAPVAANEKKKRILKMKLEFQVPEIETYRRLIDVYKARSALALNIVDALTKLDRDNDGKLSADEYRDAAYMFIATQRLFTSVDSDGDGYITPAELDAAKNMPADAAAAMIAGSNSRDANGPLLIKGYDADKDGVLTIAERKALSSAYLEIELKAQQEVAAYQKLSDDLISARSVTAAKFENVTVELADTK